MGFEETIEKYFRAWIEDDIDALKAIFTENAVYSECYGPEYHGLAQITRWFADWQKRGRVIKWDIKQFIRQGMLTAAEWYFEYEYDGKTAFFDGVSIIKFDNSGKICSVKEFQSEAVHNFPYDEKR